MRVKYFLRKEVELSNTLREPKTKAGPIPVNLPSEHPAPSSPAESFPNSAYGLMMSALKARPVQTLPCLPCARLFLLIEKILWNGQKTKRKS